MHHDPVMKSLADGLPAEIAQQIHPDWRKNEAAYWAMRDQLLAQYQGQWVGFADGVVVAAGRSPVEVFHAAHRAAQHSFFTCVGREDEPCRIRRSTFPYDTNYPGEALPVIDVEFRLASGVSGTVLDRVIADTGADASVLPWQDCQRLQLMPMQGTPGRITGVASGSSQTIAFHLFVYIDGVEHPCRLHADFVGGERILGRDVLNRMEITFRGPSGEVIVNP